MPKVLTTPAAVAKAVAQAVGRQKITDLHTHLYPPRFGTPVANKSGKVDPAGLALWGIDELVTYHYLIAEAFRVLPATKLPYEVFWQMPKAAQADHIWKHLFVERTPISEACRGVLTCLEQLGLDVGPKKDLGKVRKWFAQQDPSKYIDKVMELSHVDSITMTNNPFDDNERQRWLADAKVGEGGGDPRFKAVLRIDPVLANWPAAAPRLAEWGYGVGADVAGRTVMEGKRFLREWLKRTKAIYIAASLPPSFRYPAPDVDRVAKAGQLAFEQIVLPVCAEANIPLALMIGSRRGGNPALRDAGDILGVSDVPSIARLCAAFPQNRFLVTMLARENQHELAVTARKFGNLMLFGCWWFLNNPSLIEEITRLRLELLGTSMIPQHSDARVLDQLLYKWEHTRQIVGRVLTDKYADVVATGWRLTDQDVQADVARLFKGNFEAFLKG